MGQIKRGIRTKFRGKDVTLFSVAFFIYAVLATAFIVGFPFLIIYLNSIPLDLYIEPEYISGILTASGILFGLWAVAGGTDETLFNSGESPTILKQFKFEKLLLIVNLMIFVLVIMLLFCSIIGIIPTLFTLCVLVSSFIINCMLLLFPLLRKFKLIF